MATGRVKINGGSLSWDTVPARKRIIADTDSIRRDVAIRIKSYAQQFCPILTSTLMFSITAFQIPGSRKRNWRVAAAAPHAHLVELGAPAREKETWRGPHKGNYPVPRQPFLRPALEQVKRDMR